MESSNNDKLKSNDNREHQKTLRYLSRYIDTKPTSKYFIIMLMVIFKRNSYNILFVALKTKTVVTLQHPTPLPLSYLGT